MPLWIASITVAWTVGRSGTDMARWVHGHVDRHLVGRGLDRKLSVTQHGQRIKLAVNCQFCSLKAFEHVPIGQVIAGTRKKV